MVNTSQKGSRVERIVQDILHAHGYTTDKARMSFGAFDLCAKRGSEARYIQVKANQWRAAESRDKMLASRVPEGGTMELWRHMDHSKIGDRSGTHGIHCLRARLLLPDGAWLEIPLFPGAEAEELA